MILSFQKFPLLKEIILFTFLSGLTGLKAQETIVKSFDIRSESTRPSILKLYADVNGLIWVGTNNGIFTFDGISFNKIPVADTLSLPVSAIFQDHSATLWVGFENGTIVTIKNQKASVFKPDEGIPKKAVTAFAEDSTGKIFFSTKGEGVYCIENGRIYNINHDDGLSDDYCYSMLKLPDERICTGTDGGLNFITFHKGRKNVKILGPSEGLPDDIVRTFAFGRNNMLWIGLQDKGIAKYNLTKNQLEPFNQPLNWKYGQVNAILPVDDEFWIATEQNGIVVMDEDGNTHALKLKGYQSVKANDLLMDSENNVWISESIHLYRTTGNKIKIFDSLGDREFRYIHCIRSDKNGNIWFSPNQHLGCLRRKGDQYSYEEFKIFDKHTDISALYFDPYGYLWLGTMGEGVFRFNPATRRIKKIVSVPEIVNSSILTINGRANDVWIGGFNSVTRLQISNKGNDDNPVLEEVRDLDSDALLNDYVYSIFIDSRNRTWFGTDENGVFVLENGSLKNIYPTKNAIHSFTEDKQGRIWFSVADAGLKCLDQNDSLISFLTRDGLSDPTSTSIFCTTEGKIIVVHNNGFDVMDPESRIIFYHSSEENLSDLNPDLNSFTYSPDGNYWIGTEQGIVIYRPTSDTRQQQPRISLASVSVFLENIDYLNRKKFSAHENNFRFDYNGIWNTDPQKINYYFMLEGYSNKWELTKDHTVNFPSLSHGTYTFRIKASLNSNFSHSREATYTFIINPPFWQTWWFRLLTAGIVAFIILSIIRRRENRIRKFDRLQKEKIEFQFETLRSQVNPHFLFNSFNTLITVIENSPKLAVEYVERLSEFFRSIITYRDQNLILLSEELKLLSNYVYIQKKRYGDNLILEILLDKERMKDKFVPPLTLQLLAENAIKHNAVSKETILKITIAFNNSRLEISNNINPKLTKESSTGLGLQNIINRYELLTKEKVEIINNENKFIVLIPLLNSKDEHTDHRR